MKKRSLILILLGVLCLVGCSNKTSNNLLKKLEYEEIIEVMVADPEYANNGWGTLQSTDWEELAYRENYSDFRMQVDCILNITPCGNNGKNGVLYVNEKGEQTDNATMYMAFMNQAFIDNYWNNESVKEQLESFACQLYGDVNIEIRDGAFVNGYWNLFNESVGDELYLDGYITVTREEFLTAVDKSYHPVSVSELKEVDGELAFYVPIEDESLEYVSRMLPYTYLNSGDASLNEITYYASISKAEAIYVLVQMFYPEEFKNTTGEEVLDGYTNGGNIALEQGWLDKIDEETTKYVISAELAYGIENNVLPNDLYRAMVVAEKHGLTDDMMEEGTKFVWSEGITRADTLRLLIDVYETLGRENGYHTNSLCGIASEENQLYASLGYKGNIFYYESDNVYAYYSDWTDAVTSYSYFEGAPKSVLDEFFANFAKEVYDNKYDGETVHNKLTELSEQGYLYTTVADNDSGSQSGGQTNNGGSQSNEQTDDGGSQSNEQTDDEGSLSDEFTYDEIPSNQPDNSGSDDDSPSSNVQIIQCEACGGDIKIYAGGFMMGGAKVWERSDGTYYGYHSDCYYNDNCTFCGLPNTEYEYRRNGGFCHTACIPLDDEGRCAVCNELFAKGDWKTATTYCDENGGYHTIYYHSDYCEYPICGTCSKPVWQARESHSYWNGVCYHEGCLPEEANQQMEQPEEIE